MDRFHLNYIHRIIDFIFFTNFLCDVNTLQLYGLLFNVDRFKFRDLFTFSTCQLCNLHYSSTPLLITDFLFCVNSFYHWPLLCFTESRTLSGICVKQNHTCFQFSMYK
ncbi:UNVERIFIED_CONTAM: hypothetical protein FKN15_000582 [Acipenser sinensis]